MKRIFRRKLRVKIVGAPGFRWAKQKMMALKTLLSVLAIIGLADIVRRGYILFTHQINPIKGTIIFLVEVGFWIWLVTTLRRKPWKYRRPKFKLVLGVVLGIMAVCAFAGIEPLATYKDNTVNYMGTQGAKISASITSTMRKESEHEQIKLIRSESIDWEVILHSAKWKGDTMTMDLSIRNDGDKVATFPYEDVDTVPFIIAPYIDIAPRAYFYVRDSYNQWFEPDYPVVSLDPIWYGGSIYPGEIKRGKLQFTVRQSSGDIALFVNWYTTRMSHLFDIENPNVGD